MIGLDTSHARETPTEATHLPSSRRAAIVGIGIALVLVLLPIVAFAAPQLVGASTAYVADGERSAATAAPGGGTGDIVFVSETNAAAVGAGDIVSYRSEADELATGRVVAVEEGGIVVAGAGTEGADTGVVPPDRLVGTVSFTVPVVGHLSRFLGTPLGAATLAIPVLLIALGLAARTWEEVVPGGGPEAGPTDSVERPVRPAELERTKGFLDRVPLPEREDREPFEATKHRIVYYGDGIAARLSEIAHRLRELGVTLARSARTYAANYSWTVPDLRSVDPDRPPNPQDSSGPSPDAVQAPTGRQWSPDRTVYVTGLVVVALVLLPFVVHALPQLVGASGSFVVVSDSMNAEPAPVLAAGDVVFVYDTPPEAIGSGDVITYHSDGGTVTTHRVVDVQDDEGLYFATRGDANEEADPGLVPAERVVGTVGFAVPIIGHAIVFAGSPAGFLTLVAVPLLLLLATEARSFATATRQSDPDPVPPPGDEGPSTERSAQAVDSGVKDGPAVSESAAATYVLTRMDLRLTLLVTAAFVAYSLWIAVLVRRTWAAIVATTTFAGFVLLVALYYFGGWESVRSAARASLTDGGRTVTADSAEPPEQPPDASEQPPGESTPEMAVQPAAESDSDGFEFSNEGDEQ